MKDSKGILDKLLKIGNDMVKKAPQEPNANSTESGFDPLLKSLLAGVGGGMLGSILSGKTNAVGKVGGSAALATLAYKAYQNYRQNQGESGDIIADAKAMFEKLSNPESVEQDYNSDIRSKAMLIAIINASKADGEFDANEQTSIANEVKKISGDPKVLGWVKEQIAKPLDIQELVSLATTPQIATEIYMASIAACSPPNDKEKAYLESLRQELGIQDELKDSIEQTLFS